MKLSLKSRLLAFSAALVISVSALGALNPGAAKAAGGWTWIASGYNSTLVACNTSESGPYGPVWYVHMWLIEGSGYTSQASVNVTRNGSVVNHIDMYAGPGQWTPGTIAASKLYPDVISGSVSFRINTGVTFSVPAANISSCN